MKSKEITSMSCVFQKRLLLVIGIVILFSSSIVCNAKDLIRNGGPGAWCRIDFGLPYYFENVGTDPLTITYDNATKKYTVQGKAKLLPLGKIKTNEQFTLPADEGAIARHIDSVKTLDWGNLPADEVKRANENLAFCRCVAQYEAEKTVTDCKTIDGEPARIMFRGNAGGSCGAFGTDLRFELIGPGRIELYQLKPSGRFKVSGTVRVQQTGQVCTNGWIDKDGNVTSTEK